MSLKKKKVATTPTTCKNIHVMKKMLIYLVFKKCLPRVEKLFVECKSLSHGVKKWSCNYKKKVYMYLKNGVNIH